MTILTLDRKKLEEKIGTLTPELKEKIEMFGTPIEKIDEKEVSIEIFPNRPDLLSYEGFCRAISTFLGKKSYLKKYKTEKPQKDYKVIIDKSVKEVRPFTACAVIKGIKFSDEKIKEIIDIQEKLHGSYGRNRRKLAIGIYPLESIRFPIKFLARKPDEIKFQPLDFPKELTGRQILNQHETGRKYKHLLKGAEVYPIFEDANKEILSMPPIINSHKTGKVTPETKEIFVECSGFDKEYLHKTLNMIVCALADMGGKIYPVEIRDGDEKYLSPDLEPEKLPFSIEFLNKVLGLNLKEKEIKKCLEKMGIGYAKEKKKSIALIPPYRTDILHEIDLAEEVAIAYGYENFEPEIPQISTIGGEDEFEKFKRKVAEILIGLGMLEISTYHLSTKEKQFKKIGIKEYNQSVIEVINSKTENNILRNSLLANSIQILSENIDSAYPQKIFELGKIFYNDKEGKTETGIIEKEHLCVSICHENADFTEIKQILDYLMRMLDKKYIIDEGSHPSFIEGRCGKIFLERKNEKTYEELGIIGEIHPSVLKNNKIKMPLSSFEIDLEKLYYIR